MNLSFTYEKGITQKWQTDINNIPDSKVHWANMEPIWGRQDPGGPHVGPMNFAIWDASILHVNMLSEINRMVLLQWRHNEWCGVSNHRRIDCLSNQAHIISQGERASNTASISMPWHNNPVYNESGSAVIWTDCSSFMRHNGLIIYKM